MNYMIVNNFYSSAFMDVGRDGNEAEYYERFHYSIPILIEKLHPYIYI